MKRILFALATLVMFVGCSSLKEKKEGTQVYLNNESTEKSISASENELTKNSKYKNIKVDDFLTYDLGNLEKVENNKVEGIPLKIKIKSKDGREKEITGLNIKLREGISTEALYYNEKDYLEMIKKESPIFVKEIDGKEKVVFPVEEIAVAYEKINKDFPNLNNINDKDVKMLVEDFPGVVDVLKNLTTNDEIISVYQLLSDIYMAQQVYLVNRELINNAPIMQEKLEVNALEAKFGLTEAERRVLLSFASLNFKPFKALAVKESSVVAKLHSEAWAKELGIGTGDTKADALRHTLWMYELSRMVTEQTAYFNFGYHKKSVGIKFAEEFGTAREAKTWKRYEILKKNPEYVGNYRWLDLSNRMDLHNNFIGRSYFDEMAVSTGISIKVKKFGKIKLPVIVTPKLIVPTTEKVVEGLKDKINKGIFINKMDKNIANEFYKKGVNKYGMPQYKGQIIYLQ